MFELGKMMTVGYISILGLVLMTNSQNIAFGTQKIGLEDVYESLRRVLKTNKNTCSNFLPGMAKGRAKKGQVHRQIPWQ